MNPTQATGLVAFAGAALACAIASRRSARPWRTLALVLAASWLEVLLGLRHRLHGEADRWLTAQGWYGDRAPWQVGLLVAGALLLAAAVVGLARRRPGPGMEKYPGAERLAVWATLGVVVLFGLELVSLHATDALLYADAGPVLRIAWGWAGLAACIGTGAARAMRRAR